MSKDGEQEYIDTCAEAMFRIAMLEERLTRYVNQFTFKKLYFRIPHNFNPVLIKIDTKQKLHLNTLKLNKN